MMIEVLEVLLQRRLAARFGTAYRLAVGDILLVTGGVGGVSGVSRQGYDGKGQQTALLRRRQRLGAIKGARV